MTNETKNTPTEHSNLVGGSSAGRVLACPASVGLNRSATAAHKQRIYEHLRDVGNYVGWPDTYDPATAAPEIQSLVEARYREETTTTYAQEGTALHEAMASILADVEPAEDVIGMEWEGVTITPTLYSEAIVPALDGFDDYLDRVAEEDGEEMRFVIEKRCALPGIPGAFGTADIIACTRKRLTVWDWKFGQGVAVSPEENAQLMFYGRAAAHTMKDWLDGEGVNLDPDFPVDLVISQPRIGSGAPQVWSTTYGRLDDFRSALITAVSEAQGAAPAAKRGDHCRWCAAKHICPAMEQLGGRILDHVDQAHNRVNTPEDNFQNELECVHEITPAQLHSWLQDADDIEAWVKWVRELALSELQAGREVEGMELDQVQGNSAWVDKDKIDRVLMELGLQVKDRRKTTPITPTQARKALKGMNLNDRQQARLDKNIHRPLGALRMVAKGTAKNPPNVREEVRAKIAARLEEAAVQA